MSQTTVHTTPHDLEGWPDPYPWLADLREAGPVQRIALRGGFEAWLVTRYDDVFTAITDPRLSNDPTRAGEHVRNHPAFRRRDDEFGLSMLSTDPPDHTRLRRLVSRVFTTRRVELLRPRVQEIADALLDAMAGADTVDLVGDYAFPLPVSVICELLGVPVEDRDRFRRWSTDLLVTPVDEESVRTSMEARRSLFGYLRELVDRKRAAPGDDLLSALVEAEGEQRLTDEEVVAMGVLLLVAGHETTVNLIGTGVLLLLRNPDQLAALLADPALLPSAIEEFLRFDGPVMLGVTRFATDDIEIGGVRIPAGEIVMLSVGAANRDPARFDRPDIVDISRRDNRHAAFGHGIHVCLGAALARLEGEIAIGSVLRRFPDLALATDEADLVWRRSVIRGLQALPVRLGGVTGQPGRT
jgi:cytochrome P450